MKQKTLAVMVLLLMTRVITGQIVKPVPQPANQLQPSEQVYSVESIRPLMGAAALVSKKVGMTISYEDPKWQSPDLISAKDHPGNTKRAQEAPDLKWPAIPKSGSLEVHIPIDPITRVVRDSPAGLLESILKDHLSRGNLGEFKVVPFGPADYSIVPVRAHDANNGLVAQNSPLDTKISVEAQPRSLTSTIDAICAAIKQAGGGDVNPLLLPMWLSEQEVTLGVGQETARDALARAFRESHWTTRASDSPRPKLSYVLEYDPNSHSYVMNVYVVQHEIPGPMNNVKLEVVYY